MSIRILSLLVVFAALTGMAAGRGENSVRHRLQPVDVYVPRDGSTVWDMTQSAPCGNEVDARVTFSGDSLIEIAMPTVRYLYAVEADTLTRLLTETRFVILNDSLPLTAATPLRTEPITFPVAQIGMAFHHDFIISEGSVTLLPDVVGTLVIAPADTISGVVLRRTEELQLTAVTTRQVTLAEVPDSMRFMRKRMTYTWLRPGLPFPLAHTEVSTDSVTDRHVTRMAESWILADMAEAPAAYAPRANAPRPALDCLTGDGGAAYSALLAASGVSRSALLEGLLGRAAVTETPSDLIVTLPSDALTLMSVPEGVAGGDMTVLLTDILGRVRVSGRVDGLTVSVPHGHLPPGEYLLSVSGDAASAIRKIVLH